MNLASDPIDILNWARRPDGITTSGKLGPKDPARLKAIGVKHVINLATNDHPDALSNEDNLLADQGIAYTHIPVPFGQPTRKHVNQLCDALTTTTGPTHVHCIMNYRVTAFFYLLDRENGLPDAAARSRMSEIWDPLSSEDPRAIPWRKLLT